MLNVTYTDSIDTVRLDFIQQHAQGILEVSPIRYVREAQLRGSLFDAEDSSGIVSSVDTNFWIDHTKPLEALGEVRSFLKWPFGDLRDGYEFLLVIQVRRRSRSGFWSASTEAA